MPGQTGFDLLRSLPYCDFELIIVTAYDQYAIQAMRFAAVDYLLKPVDIDELQAAVDRATKQHKLKVQNQQLDNLMEVLRLQQAGEEQRIALPTARETRLVNVADIIHCESANNYTTFFLRTQERILVCKPIYEYEELLKPHGFLRCHQSHLVNKKWIKSWRKDVGDFLVLTNETELPVSRGKKEAVKQALNLM
jgi:two-component system LytT family response regulator